jgi:hypothetical protein
MQNDQERIVQLLSERSMGAPFIFEPEEYKKGNATREPSDLVIACNNCIIFIYMRKKESTTHINPDIDNLRQKKLIEHNLIQAKGWLSEWREGRTLMGKNNLKGFKIKYGEYKFIIILSIVDSKSVKEEYHYDKEIELKVTLCATLSQASFERLARIGASSADIINVLFKLRKYSFEENQKQQNYKPIVSDYITESVRLADPDKKWFNGNPDEKIEMFRNILQNMRIPDFQMINNSQDNDYSLSKAMNDLPLFDILRITIALKEFLELIQTDPRLMLGLSVELSTYDVVICVSNIVNMQKLLFQFIKKPGEYQKPTIFINHETTAGSTIAFHVPMNVNSFTEKILESIH